VQQERLGYHLLIEKVYGSVFCADLISCVRNRVKLVSLARTLVYARDGPRGHGIKGQCQERDPHC